MEKGFRGTYKFWAIVFALAGFFLSRWIFGSPLLVNLAAAAGLYCITILTGSLALGHDRRLEKKIRSMNAGSMKEKIEEGRERLRNARQFARDIRYAEVRDRIDRICTLADKIFKNFEDDQTDIAKASRFLLYFDRFIQIIEQYAKLNSTEEGRQILSKQISTNEMNDLLDTVEKGFTQGFQNYLSNEAAELKTVSRVLKKMISIAEIGK